MKKFYEVWNPTLPGLYDEKDRKAVYAETPEDFAALAGNEYTPISRAEAIKWARANKAYVLPAAEALSPWAGDIIPGFDGWNSDNRIVAKTGCLKQSPRKLEGDGNND